MATTTDSIARRGHVPGTTPYPWPWNGVLDAERTAVLLVDALGAPPLDEVTARNAGVVVATVRSAGVIGIRVVTREPRRATPHPAPARMGGTDAAPPIPVDELISAVGVDGFFGSSLEAALRARGIERIILVGTWLETSVHSTMRTANDMGFECLLVADACAQLDAGIERSSISMIEMSGGIFGAVGHTADVVGTYAKAEGEPA